MVFKPVPGVQVILWVTVTCYLLSAGKATFTKSRIVHPSVFTEMNVKLPYVTLHIPLYR